MKAVKRITGEDKAKGKDKETMSGKGPQHRQSGTNETARPGKKDSSESASVATRRPAIKAGTMARPPRPNKAMSEAGGRN